MILVASCTCESFMRSSHWVYQFVLVGREPFPCVCVCFCFLFIVIPFLMACGQPEVGHGSPDYRDVFAILMRQVSEHVHLCNLSISSVNGFLGVLCCPNLCGSTLCPTKDLSHFLCLCKHRLGSKFNQLLLLSMNGSQQTNLEFQI